MTTFNTLMGSIVKLDFLISIALKKGLFKEAEILREIRHQLSLVYIGDY